MIESLELELCSDCLTALRNDPGDYEGVKLGQLLKFGEFKDPDLAEAVMLLYNKVRAL